MGAGQRWAGAGPWAGALAAALLLALASAVQAQAQAQANGPATPRLLWQHEGRLQAAPAPVAEARAPLGSVWKLFVYSYLVAQGADEPPYRCEAAQRRSEEEYCCDPGEAVDRDTALARSCGPYFAPQRLKLEPGAWRGFWQGQAAAAPAPAWLLALPALQPATVVAVPELLAALQQVPAPARQAAREALLPNNLRDGAVLAALGSGPRFKTWSWTDEQGRRIGGAAGWLADGTPFWFGASGTSRGALRAQAPWLAAQWQPQQRLVAAPDAAGLQAQPCVDVDYFARYPLATVRRDDGRPVPEGPLLPVGYRLEFANGQALALRGQPALSLRIEAGRPRLVARLPLEDYVARVLDREGDARETEAARALAVAARSWLLQNTHEHGGCRAVADDSRAQRVSPQAPTPAARAAAAFTAGLVLQGVPVRYHLDQARPGQLGWQQTVAAARAGQGFESLLRQAYPGASLGGWQQGGDCQPLAQAAAWLQQRERRWRERLRAEAGFESTAPQLQVCQLTHGVPHADQRRLRIHVREWHSREGRVALIHEYLHLAFRHHPRGQDEAFVERLAQTLADS